MKITMDHRLLVWIAFMLSIMSFLFCFGCDKCVWEQWGPWSRECPCGIVDVMRNRSRRGTCPDAPSGFTCGGYDEYDYCEPLCRHQGTFDPFTKKCLCTERRYGICCESSENLFCFIYFTNVIFLRVIV